MERLERDLRAMVAHVDGLLRSNASPTVEQLTAKVRNISSAISTDASSLPSQINAVCESAFFSMGWDMQNNTVVDGDKFSAPALLETLQFILHNVEQFNAAPPVSPTGEELGSLSLACHRLWDLDVNRLVPGRDYIINLQQGKNLHQAGDFAADPLFTFVDEGILRGKPTFRSFVALLDNYVPEQGVSEDVTDEERRENSTFLHEIMKTPVMKYCHQYLLMTGKTQAADPEAFITELHHIWFELYSRQSRKLDSSGFEHVFVGEIKNNEVSGMHNWIQIYNEERKKKLDYRGYIKPRYRGIPAAAPDENQQMITMQFEWRGVLKKVSTSLIGTSPEFEIALYTMCFLSSTEGDSLVELGPYKAKITCHRWTDSRRGRTYIATSFPSESN
jgi:poly(U)-specific endoribonuclease